MSGLPSISHPLLFPSSSQEYLRTIWITPSQLFFPRTPDEPRFVHTVEAAKRTRQSERTIRRETLRDTLKAHKHGSTFQIALADFDYFVAIGE